MKRQKVLELIPTFAEVTRKKWQGALFSPSRDSAKTFLSKIRKLNISMSPAALLEIWWYVLSSLEVTTCLSASNFKAVL